MSKSSCPFETSFSQSFRQIKKNPHFFVSAIILTLSLLKTTLISAQVDRAESFIGLSSVISANRISDDHYDVVNYQKKGVLFSNVSILNRRIEHSVYNGYKCIRITEEYAEPHAVNKTTIFINDTTLAPVYYEVSVNDTVIQKADFNSGYMWFTDSLKSKGNKKKLEIPASVFLSNSFSELIESVDFNKYPKVKFETITPGNSPHRFFVERVTKISVPTPGGKEDCWLLKFTVTDLNNKFLAALYRYIDRRTGKVMALRSSMGTDSFFGYERLLFNNK